MELFTAIGRLKKFFFLTTRDVRCVHHVLHGTHRFIMFSVITNIYNKKTKGPTLIELFTATGRLKKFSF